MRAGIALGANLGDRLACLTKARTEIFALQGVRPPLLSSSLYETEPVHCEPGATKFLNAVIEIEPGALEPADVLAAAHDVEAALGRVRNERWGPRTIDIDVLLWGDLVRVDAELTVPHPRLHERAFVVLPLLDLDPDPRLPDGRRLVDLPAPQGEARPYAPPLAVHR